jgi:YgiT-type zinc finger domain-containing protein
MLKKICNVCGSENYEERQVEYLYAQSGNYLLVPNTPVEICLDCGTIYYDVRVLYHIEQHFLAIQNRSEQPDKFISMPTKTYVAAVC